MDLTLETSDCDYHITHGKIRETLEMGNVSFLFQVDLAASRNISAVATQGSVMGTWVTEYTLNYSMDGLHWNTYNNQTDGKAKVGVSYYPKND